MTDSKAQHIAGHTFFCLENFQALNGEGYRRNDIRTYKMAPLASTPLGDIYVHLCVPDGPSGLAITVRTNLGMFHGEATEEKHQQAERLVLHFPKGSDINTPKGLVQVDKKLLINLYPSWMITRYGRLNLSEGLSIRHQTPIYIDKGTKQFVYLFDESFLDELDPKLLTEGVDEERFRIYSGKGRRYLALVSRDFFELAELDRTNHKDNAIVQAFNAIRDNYLRLTLDATNLEKVILINCERPAIGGTRDRNIAKGRYGSHMSLTFGMAARHGNRYYWIDDKGNLDSTQARVVSRRHAETNRLSGWEHYEETKGETMVAIPYSDSDWDKLTKIKARLDAIQETLWDLISGCEGEQGSDLDMGLDLSIQKLVSTHLLGISNDSKDQE